MMRYILFETVPQLFLLTAAFCLITFGSNWKMATGILVLSIAVVNVLKD